MRNYLLADLEYALAMFTTRRKKQGERPLRVALLSTNYFQTFTNTLYFYSQLAIHNSELFFSNCANQYPMEYFGASA